MKNLIKLHLRNIFHNKSFYVCTALLLILSELFTLITMLTSKSAQSVKVLPEIKSFLTGEIGIIASIFLVLFTTFDFTEGTTKNIIARGYSKTKYLISKYIASFMGLLSMYGIIILIIFIAFIKNGLGYEANMPIVLIYVIFNLIAYTVLYVTLAFILEKNSSGIIACLFGTNIVTLILGIADSNLKTNVGKYWIDSVGYKFVEKSVIGNLGFPVIMYIIYTVVFVLIGMYISKNKEIK